MNYSSLGKYYDDLFVLSFHHRYSISELEALIPFERDILTSLINTHLAETAERKRLEENQMKANQNARARF